MAILKSFDYAIPSFFDNRDGEMTIKETKEFFDGPSDISKDVWREQLILLRAEITRDKSFLCAGCKKPIYIAGNYEHSSGHRRLHFRHFLNNDSNNCVFCDTNHRLTEDQIRRIIFNGQQESKLHQYLKRIIADCFISKLGSENVLEEPTLRGIDGNWRRPDVFVKLPDKDIVFEIQLTYIFLTTIIERNIVHKENGRYVAWIFNDFGSGDGSTLDSERLSKLDIFVANNYNAFVLDDEAIGVTLSSGELFLNVYYRDFFILQGKIYAKLEKRLVSFNDLTFNETNHMIYLFDSQAKYDECLHLLNVEQPTRFRNICNNVFSPEPLSSEDFNWLINYLKDNKSKRKDFLSMVYNYTDKHRGDTDAPHGFVYYNSINVLTSLYDTFATTDNPSVGICLKRCWENTSFIVNQPSIPDLAVYLLFSPVLSHLNFTFFKFLSKPNHSLSTEQKTLIQKWLVNYHKKPTYDKNIYTHFYAWMLLLYDKVDKQGLSTLLPLMHSNYKVIRAVISLAFGFLSCYNPKRYRNLISVVDSIVEYYPEYAELCLKYADEQKVPSYALAILRSVATSTPQSHDLDLLMQIFFSKSIS